MARRFPSPQTRKQTSFRFTLTFMGSLLIIFLFLSFSNFKSLLSDPDCHIFENLSQCEELSSLRDDAVISQYDSPEKDKFLADLEYRAFYAAHFECEDFEFEIFAYQFPDADRAQQYFCNLTGKSEFSHNWVWSGGINRASIKVVSAERAYYVTCSSFDFPKVRAFLNAAFPISVGELSSAEKEAIQGT